MNNVKTGNHKFFLIAVLLMAILIFSACSLIEREPPTQPEEVNLTLNIDPQEAGSVEGSGTFEEGSEVTVKANPESDYVFDGWFDGDELVSTESQYTFILNANTTLEARFSEEPIEYTVTVTAEPSDGGTVTGSGSFAEGSQVTVTADPESDYAFEGWFDGQDIVSSETSYTFTLEADIDLEARFSEEDVTYTLTLIPRPDGAGSVVGGDTFYEGVQVTATALPQDGYVFDGWFKDDQLISTDSAYSFALWEDTTLEGRFLAEYTVTVTAEPSDGGTVTGSGSFAEGSQVTVTADPESDYTFEGWFDGQDIVSSETSYTFTLEADIDLEARFCDLTEDWVYLYEGEHRMDNDNSVGVPGETLWKAAIVHEFQAQGGYIVAIAYWDDDAGAEITPLVYGSSAKDHPEVELWRGETYSSNAAEWVEFDMPTGERVETGEYDYYWIVLEVEDPGDDCFPVGTDGGPPLRDAGMINLEEWKELSEYGLDYNWLIEFLVQS